MAGKSTNRLRLESLENRWNMSTIEPLAVAAPAPEPVAVQQEFLKLRMTDVLITSVNSTYGGIDAAFVAEPTEAEPASPVGDPDTIYIAVTGWDASEPAGDTLTAGDTVGEAAGGNARFPALFNNKGTTGCVGEQLVGIDFRPQ